MRRKARCPFCRSKVDKGIGWFVRICVRCGIGWEAGGSIQQHKKTGGWEDIPRGCFLVMDKYSWVEE